MPKSRNVPAPVQVAMATPPAAPAPTPAANPAPSPAARPAQASSIYSTASAPRPPAPIPNTGIATAENLFESRGYWRGAPDSVVANDTKVEVASADPSTGSIDSTIGPWPAPPERAKAGDAAAIGYAVPQAEKIVKQAPMGSSLPRATAISSSNGMSVATKSEPEPQVSARPFAAIGQDDPWLRAMVLAPSVGAITTMAYGALDMRGLLPMLRRPQAVVAMTFSDDPHQGLRTDRFGGNAIVFMPMTAFTSRTASLR
jgi:hypothetical protein